ncbi:MAG: DUF3267 domain-containing protein [Tuberibacillus sp.]
MNCWKSFNLSKDLGSVRIAMLSLFGMVCFFVIFNLAFTNIYGSIKINQFNILLFLLCVLFVYPMHKLLHAVPIWMTGKKASVKLDRSGFIPTLFCQIPGTTSKRLYSMVILFPFLFMTGALIVLTVFYPDGIHYYSVTGAINFGISVTDLLSFFYLFSAPSHSIIEEDQNGCRILIKQYY